MKKLLICLLVLALCLPAWAETAADPLEGVEIPDFQPGSIPRFNDPAPEASEESYLACAKALWESPLFYQDTAGAAWRTEWDQDGYPSPGCAVFAEFPDGDWLYFFLSEDGLILHLDVNREAFYAGDQEDVSLSGEKYDPDELRALENPSGEERLLMYCLDFAEDIEPDTYRNILTLATGACTLVDGMLLVEVWAETPDMAGADQPGGNERHMTVQLTPEFKVLNYGPGRG